LGVHAPERPGIHAAGRSRTRVTRFSLTRPTERLGIDPIGGLRVYVLSRSGAYLMGRSRAHRPKWRGTHRTLLSMVHLRSSSPTYLKKRRGAHLMDGSKTHSPKTAGVHLTRRVPIRTQPSVEQSQTQPSPRTPDNMTSNPTPATQNPHLRAGPTWYHSTTGLARP